MTWCDERIRQDLLCHHLCRCSRERHTVQIVKGVTALAQGVAPTAPRACAETLVIVFQLWQSWVSSLAPRVDLPLLPSMDHSVSNSQVPSNPTFLQSLNFSAASYQNRTCEVCPQEFHAGKSSTIGLQQQTTSTVGILPERTQDSHHNRRQQVLR